MSLSYDDAWASPIRWWRPWDAVKSGLWADLSHILMTEPRLTFDYFTIKIQMLVQAEDADYSLNVVFVTLETLRDPVCCHFINKTLKSGSFFLFCDGWCRSCFFMTVVSCSLIISLRLLPQSLQSWLRTCGLLWTTRPSVLQISRARSRDTLPNSWAASKFSLQSL